MLRRAIPWCLMCGVAFFGAERSAAAERTVTLPPVTSANPAARLLIGSNIHFGLVRTLGYDSATTALHGLAQIGAASFRDYLPWQSFSFPPQGPTLVKSQRLMNFLPQTKLKPVLNVGSTNSFVPGGIPPLSDDALGVFDAYLKKVVELTRPYDPIYEIWNEWNMDIGTGTRLPRLVGEGPASDPRSAVNYVRVANSAVRAIKSANAQAAVIVGAVGDDIDWKWARAIVRDGAMNGADGLSVHLYNHCLKPQNRTATELIGRVKRLQQELMQDRGGVVTPIYVTEFSWPTSTEPCGLLPLAAGYNFAQFIMQSATIPWIKGIWVHELKDIGPSPTDREQNFGLFTFHDEPKPAACFVREATDLVRSADHVDVQEPLLDVFIFRARRGARQNIVLWTSNSAVKARYELLNPPGALGRPMCDEAAPASGPQGNVGPNPVVYDIDASAPVTVRVLN
ncbi:hypothetical protein [Bradyrhizobium sp. Bra78]|uniref:hypothetical protein n=2 Tax=Nitrobacteraceae TaxID=41294 RepID=UPI0021C9C8B5|nr:hypothetical protein [Bradyrhizobium sp. Bra78]